MTARDPLNEALDHFTVPPMSPALAERIAMDAMSPAEAAAMRPAPRRDRRGLWRRGGRIVIGAAAFGMISAAAVASGWLGKVGIEVPVLTAMLAPRNEVAHQASAHTPQKIAHRHPVAVPAPLAVIPAVVPTLTPADRQALRVQRRERIAQFVEDHPRAAAVIVQRVRQRMREREVARREILGLPPANPEAPGYRPLTPEERFLLRRERRRDFMRMEAMIDRRIVRRRAMQAQSNADGSTPVDIPTGNATATPAR